jgi:hypothetical protein
MLIKEFQNIRIECCCWANNYKKLVVDIKVKSMKWVAFKADLDQPFKTIKL